MSKTIKAYKGFDKNWQCRGFQFEVGKTYVEDRIAVAYVGENGIKPGVWYEVNDAGEFVEVE